LPRGEGELSIDHYLNHFPPDMRCDGCKHTLETRKFPAYSSKGTSYVVQVRIRGRNLELVVQDLIGPTRADFLGNIYLHTTKCIGTGYPKVNAIPNKEAETTRDSFREMYPGTRYDEEPRCPENLGDDNGNEWRGEFEEHILKCGIKRIKSIPEESATNSAQEQNNWEIEKGTSDQMQVAAGDYPLWSLPARH